MSRLIGVDVEIVELIGDLPAVNQAGVIRPNRLRINGLEIIYPREHPPVINRITMPSDEAAMITVTMFARKVSIAAEQKPAKPEGVQRFRKKPVEIDAMPWDGTAEGATPIIDWILANGGTARFACSQPESGPYKPEKPHTIAIDTLEGTMHTSPGDWVIRGLQGEFYPCKPGIFTDTYEAV